MVTRIGGRLPALRDSTTSGGTTMPVAVLPCSSILARNFIVITFSSVVSGCEELNQDGSEGLRINVVWLTCNGAALCVVQGVCNGIRGVAEPRGRPTVHDQGWTRGFGYSL